MSQPATNYACFISYRHCDNEGEAAVLTRFVKDLQFALHKRAAGQLEVFFDEDRIRPGYKVNPLIAESLCRSACIIALWTADYFSEQHDYCAREYCAMEKLEKARLAALGGKYRNVGLIIHVICRDKDLFPFKTLGRRPIDFSDHFLRGFGSTEESPYRRAISDLAVEVFDRCEAFVERNISFSKGCGKYRLPESHEVTADILMKMPQGVNSLRRFRAL